MYRWVVHWVYHKPGPIVIQSFRDAWLEDFFPRDVVGKQVPASEKDELFRRPRMLDDATCDRDLRSPPGNRLEKLRPPLDGKYSIRVSHHWRLVFDLDVVTGSARNVYLDPHTYR